MRDIFRRIFGNSAPDVVVPSETEQLWEEFTLPLGEDTRASHIPGWALLFRSPFEKPRPLTSWIGGLPRAPASFEWPVGDDGKPLLFFAQIDLSELGPEPKTGAMPPGLPETGALLVFMGEGFACRILSEDELEDVQPVAPPEKLGTPHSQDFFCHDATFPCWPVQPIAFLDDGNEHPEPFPAPFIGPKSWVLNWGLAALDAEIVIDFLSLKMRQAEMLLADERQKAGAGIELPASELAISNREHAGRLLAAGPPLIGALTAWRERALAQPPEQAVDQKALADIDHQCRKLAELTTRQGSYEHLQMTGSAGLLWNKIKTLHTDLHMVATYVQLPPYMRPFVQAWVTKWRGNRLFGKEPELINNYDEDLRYHDCLISIAGDELTGMETDHYYGISIWIKQEDLAIGQYEEGQVIRHSTG